MDLNKTEKRVIAALHASEEDNGGDFGFLSEVQVAGLNGHQFGGYVTELRAKGVFGSFEKYLGDTQFVLTSTALYAVGLNEDADIRAEIGY